MGTPLIPVVTIDGPGGAGKGTVASGLALRAGWHWLDSGSLYRVVGWLAEREHLLDAPDEAWDGLLSRIQVAPDGLATRIEVDGREIGLAIRDEGSGERASRVAVKPRVRAGLLPLQRACRVAPGLVTDGRDMGTVVFPDAGLKIFLTASPEARAERRLKQLNALGVRANLARLTREIAARDERDAARALSPLKPAPGAWVIDSTHLSAEGVIDTIWEAAGGFFQGHPVG